MKKWVLRAGVVFVVLLVGLYLGREPLVTLLIERAIAPEHEFAAERLPEAPDYSLASSWAALPGKTDPSDERPAGVAEADAPAGVAVFFVHPTSYINKDGWNQPLDDADANWIVDHRVLRHQASVFNGCCDVYAPRYRQATFFSFMDQAGNGEQALEVAYGDVERAFDNFLQREPDRPFVLAGHSQGSLHAGRLLRERIAGTGLRDRLVAAYLVGYAIERDELGGLPTCDGANQTGCVVGWNAVEGDGTGVFADARALLCTNPLNWQADGGYAAHSLNTGGIGYPEYGPAAEGEDYTAMPVEPQVADAECQDGVLRVRELRSDAFPSRMPGGSLHIYDYSLFYMNIRDNARTRVANWR